MADDAATRVRSMAEKMLEADVADQIAKRGRELSLAVGEASEAVASRASEAWRESAPSRREAEKALRRASRDAARWGRSTWKKDLEPTLRQFWGRRAVALGAAGAAIPAGRELVEDAAARLGIKQRREQRHWTAFFVGILIGAVIGAVAALLTTPKPGSEMRDELATSARDAAGRARGAAEKAADRAKEAAGGAGDWVPLFQREGGEAEASTGAEGEATEPSEGEGDS
jgi:gas vesicle protein